MLGLSPTPPVKQSKWSKSPEEPELTGAEAIWRNVADGELPVVFSAHRADRHEASLISLIAEFEPSGMILGGAEAWIHAEALAEDQEIPRAFFLCSNSYRFNPGSFEHLLARYDNAKILHDAGVQFAFRSMLRIMIQGDYHLKSPLQWRRDCPLKPLFKGYVTMQLQSLQCMEPDVIGENEMTVANFFHL